MKKKVFRELQVQREKETVEVTEAKEEIKEEVKPKRGRKKKEEK